MPRVLCSPSCEAVLWYRGLGLHSEGVSAQCVSRVSRSPHKTRSSARKGVTLSPSRASDTDAPIGLQGTHLLREGLHACQAEQGRGSEACLSPDRVETRVNSVAASILRSRFTCSRRPCTGSGAL